jgi:hypothetical protein
VDKAGSDVALAWGASCFATDIDYAVYEGVLGDFASHAPRLCSTGGALSATVTPTGDNVYWLVVPQNASVEGSYGFDSAGSERPVSSGACRPASVGSCP